MELQRDTTSHLTASISDWAWVPAPGELQLLVIEQAYLNSHRDPEKHPEPILVPFPWDAAEEPEDDISPAQRAALIQSFNERSAMRDL